MSRCTGSAPVASNKAPNSSCRPPSRVTRRALASGLSVLAASSSARALDVVWGSANLLQNEQQGSVFGKDDSGQYPDTETGSLVNFGTSVENATDIFSDQGLAETLRSRAADPLFQLQIEADSAVPYGRVAELMALADEGKIMPPKSTWFEPKLRSGLFVHLLS